MQSIEIKRQKRRMRIMIGLFIAVSILGILLMVAYMGLNVGHYTITITEDRKVLTISENPTIGEQGTTRLKAEKVPDAFHYSVEDLPRDIDRDNEPINGKYTGSHNGENYLAYTFYAKNVGAKTIRYRTEITVGDKRNDIYDYLRVAFYVNGRETIYANGTKDEVIYQDADGIVRQEKRECVGRSEFDAERGYHVCSTSTLYPQRQERAELFQSDDMIMQADENYLASNQITRFTVVIWIEGDDPDCQGVPFIDGAAIVLSMKMSVLDIVHEENV